MPGLVGADEVRALRAARSGAVHPPALMIVVVVELDDFAIAADVGGLVERRPGDRGGEGKHCRVELQTAAALIRSVLPSLRSAL